MAGDDKRTEFERLRETLRRSSEQNAELSARVREQDAELARCEADIERLKEQVRADDVEALRKRIRVLEVRLARLRSSAPVKLYDRVRRVPPVSWIAARRIRGYEAQLAKRSEED